MHQVLVEVFEMSTAMVLAESKQKTSTSLTTRTDNGDGKRSLSNLSEPTMALKGQGGPVYSCAFNSQGTHIVSGGHDRNVYLWDVYGKCKNWCVLRGHKNAVTSVCFNADDTRVFSSSADKSAAVWDVEKMERVRKLRGHSGFVTCVATPSSGDGTKLATTSDDGSVRVWDSRSKDCTAQFDFEYPLTSLCVSRDGNTVFVGGVDECVHVIDLLTEKEKYVLRGHEHVVTGLALSPSGRFLLSNSADQTLRTWDVRPYAKDGKRQRDVFTGHTSDFQYNLLRCAWSPDESRITAGSADGVVHVWSAVHGKELFGLPGHSGAVNEAVFHPTERIMLSCSNDKLMFLGEV